MNTLVFLIDKSEETETYSVFLIPERSDGLEFFCFDAPVHDGDYGFDTVMNVIKKSLMGEGIDLGEWMVKATDWWFVSMERVRMTNTRGAVCINVELTAKESR